MVSIGLGGNNGGTQTIVISHWVLGWAIKCRLDHVDPEWAPQEGPSLIVSQQKYSWGRNHLCPKSGCHNLVPKRAHQKVTPKSASSERLWELDSQQTIKIWFPAGALTR